MDMNNGVGIAWGIRGCWVEGEHGGGEIGTIVIEKEKK